MREGLGPPWSLEGFVTMCEFGMLSLILIWSVFKKKKNLSIGTNNRLKISNASMRYIFGIYREVHISNQVQHVRFRLNNLFYTVTRTKISICYLGKSWNMKNDNPVSWTKFWISVWKKKCDISRAITSQLYIWHLVTLDFIRV